MDDRDNLALAVHRGDGGAFERLIAEVERPLLRYAQTILQNAHDAEEVVQDALLRAHRALTRQYDETRCAELRLLPWLLRTVRNLSLNRRRGKRIDIEPLDHTLAAPDVDSDILRHDGVRRVLASLPRPTRELVVLRFAEELSYAEIASAFGATEASVRGKVFRALKQLRDLLEKEGISHAL